jgi:asparagine synthase (glutamine-hydrolysing)
VKEAGFEFDRHRQENILAMSALVHRRWLERLLHNGDIHTMHFGLEARVPFANRTVLEQVCKVYPQLGYKNGTEKYVVRRVAEKWLPPALAHRKKSSLPRDPRLGKAYQQVLYSLLKGKNEFIDAWLHRPALEALCVQKDITENHRLILFNMICLIYWAEQYAK